jgi:serine/threonine-protein kinase RsbT
MMELERKVRTLEIQSPVDVVSVRQAVRQLCLDLGFSLVDQTKIVTAASELARNTLDHGGGGKVLIETVDVELRRVLKLTFSDQGPGIPNLEQALQDGYTTGKGLGIGLGGAKRLANEFQIESQVGQGTRVTIVKWK